MKTNKRFLAGNPLNLIRAARKYGGVDRKGWLLFSFYLFKSFFFFPLNLVEYLFSGKKIANTALGTSPVFILGHYRSGTTLLFKLMSRDKRFGYCTNSDMLFPYIKTPFNHFFRKAIQKFLMAVNAMSFAYRDTRFFFE